MRMTCELRRAVHVVRVPSWAIDHKPHRKQR